MTGGNQGVAARFVVRGDGGSPGTRHRVLVGETGGPQVDVTGVVVAAIAHALWQARGGDAMTNWADAERAIDSLAGEISPAPGRARLAAPEPKPASAPSAVPGSVRRQPTRR